MSSRVADSLSRKRMQQLLAAVGSTPQENAAQVETTEYNWYDPHYFSTHQLAKLDQFAQTAARAMARRFSDFCRSRFDVTITSITQHFASELSDKISGAQQKDYFVPFGIDPERPCGFVGMPERTASAWARQLLGDCESEEDSGRALSGLEESLLLDLTSALVEVFCDSDAICNFCLTTSVVRGRWPLELRGIEEVCRMSLDVKKADSQDSSAAYFLIPCRELDAVAGRTTRAGGEYSASEISKAILDHLYETTVTITAQLASTTLTFGQIMNLQVNDMLLLDKTVDEPIELIVDHRTVYSGRPAKSAGRYAVAISGAAIGDVA
ncbi:MAG: FliM/FliN family flagellar motor switch protein [Phycisphaerae bacterium]|nr:FliM/FliN family flagellar motor switch protein [Phycisphaerae bacterium]